MWSKHVKTTKKNIWDGYDPDSYEPYLCKYWEMIHCCMYHSDSKRLYYPVGDARNLRTGNPVLDKAVLNGMMEGFEHCSNGH